MVGKQRNSQILVNLPATNAQRHVSHNVGTLAALDTSASSGPPGRARIFDMMNQLLLIFQRPAFA